MKKTNAIVPRHTKGSRSGAKHEVDSPTHKAAQDLFNTARARLLDINNWDLYSGHATSTFCLTNAQGEQVNRKPRPGDYIRIDLPGPGPRNGGGYDWVTIEAVDESYDHYHDEDYCAFRVRPAAAPGSDSETTAHFLTGAATSSFIVHRQGKKVIAAEEGRNEKINFARVSIIDKIRNALVAKGAAWGVSKLQWKTLVKGLLRQKEK